MKMNEKIRTVLIMMLKDEVIVASWGISNIRIADSALVFDVCGFLYQGTVTIVATDISYRIQFEDGVQVEVVLANILETLDQYIEKDASYMENISNWLQSN